MFRLSVYTQDNVPLHNIHANKNRNQITYCDALAHLCTDGRTTTQPVKNKTEKGSGGYQQADTQTDKGIVSHINTYAHMYICTDGRNTTQPVKSKREKGGELTDKHTNRQGRFFIFCEKVGSMNLLDL